MIVLLQKLILRDGKCLVNISRNDGISGCLTVLGLLRRSAKARLWQSRNTIQNFVNPTN